MAEGLVMDEQELTYLRKRWGWLPEPYDCGGNYMYDQKGNRCGHYCICVRDILRLHDFELNRIEGGE